VTEAATPAPPVSRPGRVLVVEDDPDIGRLLMLLLSRAGLTGALRTDGVSGLAAVAEVDPDVLVLDVGLPGMSGWEVLEQVRMPVATGGRRLPVLLLSAHAHETDQARGLRLGADEFVFKPFRNSDLVSRLRLLLDGARRERSP
jgi:DNA-binding response OmpR family regulator